MTRKSQSRTGEAKTVRGTRSRRDPLPESREERKRASHAVRSVARRKIRSMATRGQEMELFPRPEAGPVSPGNRCLAEIADLEERFADGELTWHDYSQLLRELAPVSDSA